MAFLAREDPEDILICPYDDTHMISHKRFIPHVNKCVKNHPFTEMKKCPFNARHYVHENEFRHHLAKCPDSQHIEQQQQYLAHEGEVMGGYLKVPEYDNRVCPDSSEDWDAETSAPAFILGQPPHKDFTSCASQPHLPCLSHQYARAEPNQECVVQQHQLRVPKELPKVLQKNATISSTVLGVAPGTTRGGRSQYGEWTAVGRGRSGFSCSLPTGGDGLPPGHLYTNVKTSRDQSPLSKTNSGSNKGSPHTSDSVSRLNSGPMMTGIAPQTTAYSMVGRGRCRGREIVSVSAGLPGRISSSVSTSADSPLTSSDSLEQFEDDIDRERLKQTRKLRKKLKQIELLQERLLSGQTLTQEELDKIEKRETVLQQLRTIKMVTE